MFPALVSSKILAVDNIKSVLIVCQDYFVKVIDPVTLAPGFCEHVWVNRQL